MPTVTIAPSATLSEELAAVGQRSRSFIYDNFSKAQRVRVARGRTTNRACKSTARGRRPWQPKTLQASGPSGRRSESSLRGRCRARRPEMGRRPSPADMPYCRVQLVARSFAGGGQDTRGRHCRDATCGESMTDTLPHQHDSGSTTIVRLVVVSRCNACGVTL